MTYPYGFTAHKDRSETGWCVYLPHQCDSWDIAGGGGSSIDTGEPLGDAITSLEQFIYEATACLNALRDGRETGDEPWWRNDDLEQAR